MMQHPSDAALALYSSKDLDWKDRLTTAWHVRSCGRCRSLAADFAADRRLRATSAANMPLPANWDSLAEEMTANIRLGLSASECVRPVAPPMSLSAGVRPGWFWKPALGIGLSMALVAVALVSSQRDALHRVWNAAAQGANEVPLVVLESSSNGVEMRRGTRTTMSLKVGDHKADQYSANLDGSVRAQYVDDDSFQVTVTNVYAQ